MLQYVQNIGYAYRCTCSLSSGTSPLLHFYAHGKEGLVGILSFVTLLTLSAHVLQGLQYLSCVCVCVCVCLSVRLSCLANLRTGASRRLTEGTSGLSGILFTKIQT